MKYSKITRPSPYDPASYPHLNERNARGAAAMARLINKSMRAQRPELREFEG